MIISLILKYLLLQWTQRVLIFLFFVSFVSFESVSLKISNQEFSLIWKVKHSGVKFITRYSFMLFSLSFDDRNNVLLVWRWGYQIFLTCFMNQLNLDLKKIRINEWEMFGLTFDSYFIEHRNIRNDSLK